MQRQLVGTLTFLFRQGVKRGMRTSVGHSVSNMGNAINPRARGGFEIAIRLVAAAFPRKRSPLSFCKHQRTSAQILHYKRCEKDPVLMNAAFAHLRFIMTAE